MRKTFSAMCCLAAAVACSSASADITNPFSSTAYASTDANWAGNTAQDIDGNGLGTDGYFFFGLFAGGTNNNQPFTRNTQALPTYVTSVASGSDFLSVADNPGVAAIYDPVLDDGTLTIGGTAVARNGTGLPAGDFIDSALTFTLSGLTDTVRVGILAGNEGSADGRWDPTSVTLTDGTFTETVGDHAASPLPDSTGANWVFFDIDTDGTYTLGGTKSFGNGGNQGISFGGLTFDTVAVPEPSSLALLGLGGLGMFIRRRK